MNWQRYVHVNLVIRKVRPSTAGTCTTINNILDSLAEGMVVDEVSEAPLRVDDVRACMAYAAALAHGK